MKSLKLLFAIALPLFMVTTARPGTAAPRLVAENNFSHGSDSDRVDIFSSSIGWKTGAMRKDRINQERKYTERI